MWKFVGTINMETVLEIIPEVVNLLSDVQEEYSQVESVAELCVELNNFVVAQETKVKIACILHRLLRGFMDRPMILLYGKFTMLEGKLTSFILDQLEKEFNRLHPTMLMAGYLTPSNQPTDGNGSG